jgi:dUTP pyrophosphatase
MKLKYKKLRDDAKAPIKKIDIDAGFDLTAVRINKTDNYIEYGTGLAFEIPEGYVGLIFPRSSVTNYDLMLKNSIGVIDASYRGEIMCRFTPVINNNIEDIMLHGEPPIQFILNEENQYKVGERVCQIVFLELPYFEMEEVQELSETERGAAGYGSSGK